MKTGFLHPQWAAESSESIGIPDVRSYKKLIQEAADRGQSLFQVLPMSKMDGTCPYSILHSCAMEERWFEWDENTIPGLVGSEEMDAIGDPSQIAGYKERIETPHEEVIDIQQRRRGVIFEAFEDIRKTSPEIEQQRQAFASFCGQEGDWLEFYSAFMAYADRLNMPVWQASQEYGKQFQTKDAFLDWTRKQGEDFQKRKRYHQFSQYICYSQWDDLKRFADKRNVEIIGDVPVAYGNLEYLEYPEYFREEYFGVEPYAKGRPDAPYRTEKGGHLAPWGVGKRNGDGEMVGVLRGDLPYAHHPDLKFIVLGQHWGTKGHDVHAMEKSGWALDLRRMRASGRWYHRTRIDAADHYARYWSIPWNNPDEVARHYQLAGLSAICELPTLDAEVKVSSEKRFSDKDIQDFFGFSRETIQTWIQREDPRAFELVEKVIIPHLRDEHSHAITLVFHAQGLKAVKNQYDCPSMYPEGTEAEIRERTERRFHAMQQALQEGASRGGFQSKARLVAETAGPRPEWFDEMLRDSGIGGWSLAVLKLNQVNDSLPTTEGYPPGTVVASTNHDYPVSETSLIGIYAVLECGTALAQEIKDANFLLRKIHEFAGFDPEHVLENTCLNRRRLALATIGREAFQAYKADMDLVIPIADALGLDHAPNQPGTPSENCIPGRESRPWRERYAVDGQVVTVEEITGEKLNPRIKQELDRYCSMVNWVMENADQYDKEEQFMEHLNDQISVLLRDGISRDAHVSGKGYEKPEKTPSP